MAIDSIKQLNSVPSQTAYAGEKFIEILNKRATFDLAALAEASAAAAAEVAREALTKTDALSATVTVGQIVTWSEALALPSNGKWLRCDEAEVAKADYPELYAAIGDAYGDPVDPNNFVLPWVSSAIILAFGAGSAYVPIGLGPAGENLPVDKDGTLQLTHTTTEAITYKSSNADVVSVDTDGLVTGIQQNASAVVVASTASALEYKIITVNAPVTGIRATSVIKKR